MLRPFARSLSTFTARHGGDQAFPRRDYTLGPESAKKEQEEEGNRIGEKGL